MTWDDFEADARKASRPTGGRCGVRKMLDALPVRAREKVQAALDDPEMSNASIAKALRAPGRVGESAPKEHTIARHRRGDCSCGDE